MAASKLKSVVLTLMILLLAHRARAQQVSHPLDALNVSEVSAVVNILKRAGKVDKDTLFAAIRLKEPPKSEMWAWRAGDPFTRTSTVIFRRGPKTFQAIVDISSAKVITVVEKKGVQSSILISEWRLAQELTIKDRDWQKAMRARGFTDFNRLFCSPILPGYLPGRDYGNQQLISIRALPGHR